MIRVMGGASVIAADFVPGWLRRAKGSGRHADRLTGVAEFGAWTPPHGGNYTSTGANTEHGMGRNRSARSTEAGLLLVGWSGSGILPMVRDAIPSVALRSGAQQYPCTRSVNRA